MLLKVFHVDKNFLKLLKYPCWCCSKLWSTKPCSSRTCCSCTFHRYIHTKNFPEKKKKISLILLGTIAKLELWIMYRGSPHRTEKWEAGNTVLCETVLFLIEYRGIAKTVLCETLLHKNPYYARN